MSAPMQFLSFNESYNGNGKIANLPDEDGDTQVALLEPMSLRSTWVLWEQAVSSGDGKSSNYADAMKEIVAFGTAQDFWRIWNGVPQPSALVDNRRITRESQASGSPVPIDAIMIFKQGIRPEWEDPLNSSGGHLQVQLKPGQVTGGPAQIDEYWNNIVLAMVGGVLDPYDVITGVRLVDKLAGPKAAGVLRIELWFAKYDDAATWKTLQKNFEKCMSMKIDGTQGPPVKCECKGHSQAGKH